MQNDKKALYKIALHWRIMLIASLTTLVAACGGGGGGTPVSNTSVTLDQVGLTKLVVKDEGDSVTVLVGQSRKVVMGMALAKGEANTTENILVTLQSGDDKASVSRETTKSPYTLAVNPQATAGDYPLVLHVSNRQTGKSTTVRLTLKVVQGVVSGSGSISPTQTSAPISSSVGNIVVESAVNQSVNVKVVESETSAGKKLFRLEFDQDMTGKSITVTLPSIAPSTAVAAKSGVLLEQLGAKTLGAGRALRAGDSGIVFRPAYEIIDELLGSGWQQTYAWFSDVGDHRLPEGTKVVLQAESKWSGVIGSSWGVDLQAHTFLATELNSTAMLSSVNPANAADYEPVLFIHGFTLSPSTASLGGGKGTFGNFPALVGHVDGLGVTGKKFIPFEFRWATSARFGDVAVDLAKAINLINQKTGKKVHVVAHSFGGALSRVLLQKISTGYAQSEWQSTIDSAVASVASLTTLGTPHSGIADSDGASFPGASIFFPRGQDATSFEACEQISCYQMGESVGFGTITSYLKLQSTPGEVAAQLYATRHQLPAIPITVGIGLTRYDDKRYFHDGDLLISYRGQRFSPTYTTTTALRKNETVGLASVSEYILGVARDVKPGDMVQGGDFGSRSFGYVHAASTGAASWVQDDGDQFRLYALYLGLEAGPSLNCGTVATCDHAGFLLFQNLVAPPPSVTTITPAVATVGVNQKFAISGTNLPINDHFDITFNGCANIVFTTTTATLHEFTCTPQAVGPITADIRLVPNGAILKSQAVAVTNSIIAFGCFNTDYLCDNFNGTLVSGLPTNVQYSNTPSDKGLLFGKVQGGRVDYPITSAFPKSGTVEMMVKVESAYGYNNYALDNRLCAPLFLTDWADVTWPGSTWLWACSDGKVTLDMATTKYDGPRQKTEATGTDFGFGKWVRVGFSYGSGGQSISVNGVIVASNTTNTQLLGSGGTHTSASNIATIGEYKSKFFGVNQYEGGYEGVIDWLRISGKKDDWLK